MSTQNASNCDEITFNFSGQISINRDSLKRLLSELRPEFPPELFLLSEKLAEKIEMPKELPEKPGKNKRLTYSMSEAAEILGVHYITVHRLIQRGLLKKSKAVRKIIIPATEIERFLRETL